MIGWSRTVQPSDWWVGRLAGRANSRRLACSMRLRLLMVKPDHCSSILNLSSGSSALTAGLHLAHRKKSSIVTMKIKMKMMMKMMVMKMKM